MMKKGRKREDKGLAVAHFIIGLVMLLIILAAIYWTLVELDYSDKVRDPDATMRPYVETTLAPAASNGEQTFVPVATELPDSVDLTAPTATPTPAPTATPEPSATPEPTPEPTAIPEELYAQARTTGFTVPEAASENGVVGITSCYVSPADDNRVMAITGFGYVDDARFDATLAQSYLVVIPQESPRNKIAYPVTMKDGASGLTHETAQCQNASAGDFEVVISLGDQYKNDIYALELAISFTLQGSDKRYWMFYPFSSDVRFTVLDGQVITPIEALTTE